MRTPIMYYLFIIDTVQLFTAACSAGVSSHYCAGLRGFWVTFLRVGPWCLSELMQAGGRDQEDTQWYNTCCPLTHTQTHSLFCLHLHTHKSLSTAETTQY